MTILTVYTPTYNRAYTLGNCYQSLLRQTRKDFIWLIVDDGSTDNTKELVSKWMLEDQIRIEYIYQKNQGVHIARNTAIENTNTELNVCIDSDDYLTDDAVELIIGTRLSRDSDKYIGVIGWDIYKDGSVVGKEFPIDLKEATLVDLYEKYKIPGDKKPVYKTSIAKKYPSPSFSGEKYFPNRYKYIKSDEHGPLLLIHAPLCVVEYLPDGITASLYSRYYRNPLGFIFYREFLIEKSNTLRQKLRQAIHLNAMHLIIGDKKYLKESKYKTHLLLTLPLGLVLFYFIKFKNKGS